jgi:hypothetical protein
MNVDPAAVFAPTAIARILWEDISVSATLATCPTTSSPCVSVSEQVVTVNTKICYVFELNFFLKFQVRVELSRGKIRCFNEKACFSVSKVRQNLTVCELKLLLQTLD